MRRWKWKGREAGRQVSATYTDTHASKCGGHIHIVQADSCQYMSVHVSTCRCGQVPGQAGVPHPPSLFNERAPSCPHAPCRVEGDEPVEEGGVLSHTAGETLVPATAIRCAPTECQLSMFVGKASQLRRCRLCSAPQQQQCCHQQWRVPQQC